MFRPDPPPPKIIAVERYTVSLETLRHLPLGNLMIVGEQTTDFRLIVLLVFLRYAWHVMR